MTCSTSDDRLRLSINSDWRGVALPEAAWRQINLWREGEALRCLVRSPEAGDPSPDQPPGRLWELWLHEVVELFIAGPDGRYLELEFGPRGHYLALQLHGEHNIVGYDLFIDYQASSDGLRWRGEARVPWQLLPDPPHRLNAYAMFGPTGEQRRHLALHPLTGAEPDFHQLASFRPAEIPRLDRG